ncbi:expressed unknown protein [Seminavis robusta]|uniref:SnoaL-like domain-containing protein n=1 Tax=Seminavis robusta TaxID=568900 RepID=A0A9N8EJX9_9STRA|nr:expressed unknown protein [Seminavis robusta]|eukprot:Sro1268_g257780.1 n/a (204) ;mRNA; r:18704-19315
MPGIKKWLSKRLGGNSFSRKRDAVVKEKSESVTTMSEHTDVALASMEQQDRTKDVEAVERWIEMWRQKRLDDVVALSCPDCQYHVTLDDGEMLEVKLQDFIDQMKDTYESFPDYDTAWESVEPDATNGAIVIRNFTSKATHTGKPFAFGPYPAIPASGAEIHDDAISMYIFLKDGKPIYIKTALEGVQIGPAAYYTQIGGIII